MRSWQRPLAPMWVGLLVRVEVVTLMLGMKGRSLYLFALGTAVVGKKSAVVSAAFVVLHRDLAEVQQSSGYLAAAQEKCDSATAFVAVVVVVAAAAVAAVSEPVAGSLVVPCNVVSIPSSHSPYLLHPFQQKPAVPCTEVRHQIVILVACSARSCAAPGVAFPAESSLLLVFSYLPRTLLGANSALIHQRLAMTKVLLATGRWTYYSRMHSAQDWARSSPTEAGDLGVVCSSFVGFYPYPAEVGER